MRNRPQGFPRSARLLAAEAFRRVFRRCRRSADRCFTVLARPNHGQPARLGLAISRRQAHRAVDRNRLKRLVRESFRRHGDLLHGLDLVVMNRPGAQQRDNRELFRSLELHWSRLSGPHRE